VVLESPRKVLALLHEYSGSPVFIYFTTDDCQAMKTTIVVFVGRSAMRMLQCCSCWWRGIRNVLNGSKSSATNCWHSPKKVGISLCTNQNLMCMQTKREFAGLLPSELCWLVTRWPVWWTGVWAYWSASKMTYIMSGWALNSTHSLTHSLDWFLSVAALILNSYANILMTKSKLTLCCWRYVAVFFCHTT